MRPMTQTTIFDALEQARLRDEAIERVKTPDRNLYRECLIEAYEWLDGQPDGRRFTAGQMAMEAGQSLADRPAEPRVWGAVVQELVRRKRIVPTGEFSRSCRSHGGIAAVWEVRYGR